MGRILVFSAVFICLAYGNSLATELAARGAVRPSFQITPLVQRFSARQGQRIKFAFAVQTLDKGQSLRIRAVALKQQLNGLVVADETAPPPGAVELFGPLQMDLKAEQTATIRGHVNIPLSPAPFHSYGILVTDLGRPLQNAASANETAIDVRFVTQYLLRLEVEVRGGLQENAKELRIESARLAASNGYPLVAVDIANPTAAAVEFQLYCRLLKVDGAQTSSAFGLALPVRSGRPEPQRYESLIFGQGRVALIAPVPTAVFPGQYQIELEWLSRGRKCGKASFPVTVSEGDFPAQASTFAQVAGAVRVTPSQIELSMGRGGSRRLPLRIDNDGLQPVQIRLAALNLDGTAADWVLLQPNDFLLLSGRGRNVLLTAQAGSEVDSHRYGSVRIDARVGGTSGEARYLSLALLTATAAEPVFEAGSVHWDPKGKHPAFVLPINNRGPVHLSLNGRLTFSDVTGQQIDIPGGFDRWLLPGRQDEIRFPLYRGLPPGTYSVKVHIQEPRSLDPMTLNQQVTVEPDTATAK